MSMRACPECGSSVKLENMKRHYANVHPGKDPSAAISDQEHREIVRTSRVGGSSTSRRRVAVAALVILALVGVGYFGLPYILGSHPNANFNVLTYCGGEGSIEHYHPLLVINVNGAQQPVPADIGLTPSETNPAYPCSSGGHGIHTHDTSGIIHLELPAVPATTPTLGDFFTIWGQTLGPSGVWTYSGTVRTTMYDSDTHGSTDFSSNPTSLPLYPSPQGPTANPYPIPQNLIFYGQGGNDGASGGVFSGEIIWVNVTTA